MKWDNKANLMKCISFLSNTLSHFYFIPISFLFHIYFIPTHLFYFISCQIYIFLFHSYFIPISLWYHCCFIPFHCDIIAISFLFHFYFIAISFPPHCDIIAISFPFHCNIIAVSLLFHCYFIVISLWYHWYFISIPFLFHCDIIAISLWVLWVYEETCLLPWISMTFSAALTLNFAFLPRKLMVSHSQGFSSLCPAFVAFCQHFCSQHYKVLLTMWTVCWWCRFLLKMVITG